MARSSVIPATQNNDMFGGSLGSDTSNIGTLFQTATTPPQTTSQPNNDLVPTPPSQNVPAQPGGTTEIDVSPSSTPTTSTLLPEVSVTATPLPPTITPIANQPNVNSTINIPDNPNILDQYFLPTYHFRLFVSSEPNLLGSGSSSLKDVFAKLDASSQVTLAETGITGFNIKDVEIETIVAPNSLTRNVNAKTIKITIVEPMGVAFLDALMAATQQLNINNMLKFFYYLELTFKGYDTSGTPVTSALGQNMHLENGGRWLYQLSIIDMDVKTDTSGGTYVITAIPFIDMVMKDQITSRASETIAIEASTLGDFFTKYGDALSKSFEGMYGGKLVTYKIKFGGINNGPATINNKDITKFKLVPQDAEKNPIRGLTMDQKSASSNPIIQISPDADISDVIQWALCSCEEIRNLGYDRNNNQSQTDLSGGEVNDRGYRESTIFRIETDTQITGFDSFSNQYIRDFTYYIWGYYTQAPALSRTQIDKAKDASVQKAMTQQLIAKKFLAKRYDFLFTGNNIDILDFDVHFNFPWDAVVARFAGAIGSRDATSYNSRLNTNNTNIKKTYNKPEAQTDLQVKRQNVATALSNLQSTNTALASATSQKNDLLTQLQNTVVNPEPTTGLLSTGNNGVMNQLNQVGTTINGLTQQKNTQVGIVEQARQALNDATNALNNANQISVLPGTKTTAEEIIASSQSSNSNSNLPFTISLDQLFSETSDNLGTGTVGQYHRDKSMFGALLEQMTAPVTSQFITINLTIRGDPYWLGEGTLERQVKMRNSGQSSSSTSSTLSLPVWVDGDHTFLLTFRYPLGLGSDSQPILKSNDFFAGIYRVIEITHRFSEGTFKQVIKAFRMPLHDITKAFGGSTTSSPNLSGSSDGSSNSSSDSWGDVSSNNNPGMSSTPAIDRANIDYQENGFFGVSNTPTIDKANADFE